MSPQQQNVVSAVVEALRCSIGERALPAYNRRWGARYASLHEVACDLLDPTKTHNRTVQMQRVTSTPEVTDALRLALFWFSRG